MAPQLFLSAAMNSGSAVLNHTNDCRRALTTAGRCDGDRIGKIFAMSSSSEYSRAISRRKASPFRRLTVDRYADANTRRLTASGVTGGMSSPATGSRSSGIATEEPIQPERGMTRHGECRFIPGTAQRQAVTPDWAQTQIGEG